jgi:hypothetical protein
MLCAGCGGESEKTVRAKLEVVLRDDLQSVVAELPDSSVADSAYYDLTLFNRYDEGKYSHKAVAEFHFLEQEVAVMVRKYRYHRAMQKWDRYFNEYRLVHEADSGRSSGDSR